MAAVLTTGLYPRPDDRPTDGETLLARLESAIEETHGRRWLAAAGLGAIGSTAATIAAGTTLTGTATTATAATAGTGARGRGRQTRHLDAHPRARSSAPAQQLPPSSPSS